ncbi:MAG TPA: hypothetical protein VN032_09675 [Thermoanaerobaculia bacterium]|jgi:hypothetical protein|nr:hypothetical protein [Thermoanaerobaculia bacterium]
MRSTSLLRVAALAVSALFGVSAAVPAASPSRKSPFVQIVGEGTIATAPRETVHKNGRRFLEFEITLVSARPAAEQPAGADRGLAIDTAGRVKVVHDLSCGGAAVMLAVGDRVAIGGEYVHIPRGGDLIHFTHPADGSCGRGGAHPAGFLRRLAAPPVGSAQARPASLVPDQPYTGPPPAGERPSAAIVAAKENGASDAQLLAKIEREKVVYSLTTPEIQKLRAAGISQAVIEAMLRSGRVATPAAAAP